MASGALSQPQELTDGSVAAWQPRTPACRRRWKRIKVFEPVLMHRGGLDQRIHLLNLSPGGAYIYAAATLVPGQAVRLRLAGNWIAAWVTWANNGYCGIAFGQPLGHEPLAALCNERDPSISPER